MSEVLVWLIFWATASFSLFWYATAWLDFPTQGEENFAEFVWRRLSTATSSPLRFRTFDSTIELLQPTADSWTADEIDSAVLE